MRPFQMVSQPLVIRLAVEELLQPSFEAFCIGHYDSPEAPTGERGDQGMSTKFEFRTFYGGNWYR